MSYYIYKMIHVPTGRVYIGQHKLPKGKTPETDNYFGSGRAWKNIYKAHPDECVKVVLDWAETREEVDALEVKYIAHYKAVYGKLCVNIAKGGRAGGTEKRFTEEELKEHARLHSREYRKSARGKEVREKYMQSEKYQTYERERRQTESYKRHAAARQRRYRQNHLEEIREKDRQRDKIRGTEKMRKYRAKHREEYNKKQREYRAKRKP